MSSPQTQRTPSHLSRRSGGSTGADLLEGIRVLERCGELQLAPETKSLLLQISRSSIDRYLTPVRFPQPHGRSTTKPGSLLKKQIPIRTFADWIEDKPGFFLILMKRIVGIQNRLHK